MRKHQQPRTRKTRKPRELSPIERVTREACDAIRALGSYRNRWRRDEKPHAYTIDIEYIEALTHFAKDRLKTCRERDFPRWMYRDRGPALNPAMFRELPPVQ